MMGIGVKESSLDVDHKMWPSRRKGWILYLLHLGPMNYKAKALLLGSILMLLLLLVVHAGGNWRVLWSRGSLIQLGGIIVIITYIPLVAVYLQNYRTKALEQVRSAVRISREEYDRIIYHMNTVNPVTEALATLAGLALGLYEGFRAPSEGGWLLMAYGRGLIALMFTMLAAVIHYDIHLRLWLARLLKQPIDINIFDPNTMRPIASLALRRSLIMLGGVAIAVLSFSRVAKVTVWSELLIYVVVLILGLLDFLVPLLIIHRRMTQLKYIELKATRQKMHQAYKEIHERLESGNLQGINNLSRVVLALVQYENRLKQAHTWPFEPQSAVASLAGGALLPTIAWFLQRLLNQLVH